MFRNSHNPWGVSVLLQRTIRLALILVFGMGSAGQTTSAQAAEPRGAKTKSITQIVLDIRTPPEPVCVNKSYTISVITIADTDVTLKNGKVDHISAEPRGGVTVESSVGNPSIGTLNPNGLVTGFDLDAEPGEGQFTFEAKKAGTTSLKFKGTYRGRSFKDEKQIKVVNCDYKVTMNATDVYTGDGVTIWTAGNLDTKITGESGEMQGTGSFAFDSGFVGPPCSISYSEYQNATTITGHLDDNDQLVLDFQYQPGEITSQVSCPDSGGGSASQTVDLTNTGIASVTFPATGGTRMLRFTYAGSDFPPGTMIIDVQPEEAGG